MSKYEVLFRSEKDDDTESIYNGTAEACRHFVMGYLKALEDHTHYKKVESTPPDLNFASPLISQYRFTVWIEEVK